MERLKGKQKPNQQHDWDISMPMNVLYLLFIQPLEFWMDLVLKWGFSLTHSWGLAVVFLSLVVNTAILPIYNKAESWQEEERELKRRIFRHEAMIRRTFRGQKRFALQSVLRRQHGYTPFLGLRASVGLLLQIPFFFAAYHLLSHHAALYGQAFGPFADLGAPDALLVLGDLRLNLLPIAMTVVNLASAFVYTRTLSRRDKIQLYGMAALFLLLLYNAPAALTLYWTLNNVYSLGKNLVEKWWLRSCTRQDFRVWLRSRHVALLGHTGSTGDAARAAAFLVRELVRFVHAALYGFGIGAVFWLVTCAAVLASYHGAFNPSLESALAHFTFHCVVTALLASGTLYCFVTRYPHQKLANHPLVLFASVVVLFLSQLKFFKYGFEIQENRLPFDKLNGQEIVFFFLFPLAIFFIQRYYNRLFNQITKSTNRQFSIISRFPSQKCYKIYINSCAFILLLVLYISFSIYNADISIYTLNAKYIYISIVTIISSFFVLSIIVFIFIPHIIKCIFSFTFCFIVISCLINYLLSYPDLGILEGTIFHNTEFFDKKIILSKDLFLQLFFPLLVAYYIIFYKEIYKLYNILLIIFSLTLLILSNYIIIPHIIKNEENISYKDKLHLYSKSEENVVILIFDMFTGGHIEEMIDDSWFDNFSSQFDGFTWYPDTISAGEATLYSLPSIYGGFGYTPDVANKNKLNIVEFINKSYAVMPRNFSKNLYDVVMVNGLPEFDKNIYKNNIERPNNVLTIIDIKNEIVHDVKPFFLTLSLFQISPNIIRKIIYNKGKWHNLLKQHEDTEIDIYKNEYDFLSYAINNRIQPTNKNPTFRIFYSMLSHIPWHFMPDLKHGNPEFVPDPYPETNGQLIFKDGMIPEHYFAERHLMHMVIKYIERLKRAEIYDNTRIILVSDHGYTDSPLVERLYNNGQLPSDGCEYHKRRKCKNRAYPPGRPHALLMVKEPNQRGPLRISSAFMSSADVPALAMKGLGSCDEFELYDPEHLPAPRLLTHATGPWQLEKHNSNSFNCKFFRFEGTLFDPSKVSEIQLDQLE